MNIQIASPDHISKLLAFIAVKAKGTRFEIPASLLQNVESELRDFCKARRITVQFKDASTERVCFVLQGRQPARWWGRCAVACLAR
jgi:hypothetical protein